MPDKKNWNLEILKEVIQIMKDEDVAEVSIEQNGMKMKVKRTLVSPIMATQGAAILASHEKPGDAFAIRGDSEEDFVIIPAPMVGTFYRAQSPDADPFVEVGDEIESGQVICIIEAMKLMNEITADLDGEILEILAEDGQPVEYDQPLFRVRPR